LTTGHSGDVKPIGKGAPERRTPFHAKYHNDETGRLAINPKILLKILLLAFSRGIIGSRRIERACHENIFFMAPTRDYRPDHSIIPSLQGLLQACRTSFPAVFSGIAGLPRGGTFGRNLFCHGRLQDSRECFKKRSGTLQELNEKKESWEKKIARLILEHQKEDKDGSISYRDDPDSPGIFAYAKSSV
jgi:hypothetical protein